VLWTHDRYDFAKLERFEVYELMQRSPGATAIVHKGALGRLTV
jgi:hypothetical protein